MQRVQLYLFCLTLLHIVCFSNELIVMTFEHFIQVSNIVMKTHYTVKKNN